MARPKTKSALVEGMTELVGTLRNIESKLVLLFKAQGKSPGRRGRPGRPAGTGKKRPGRPRVKKRGPGRPAGKRKPGRPAASSRRGPGRPAAKKRGRPAAKRRGRPAGR